MPQYTVEPSVPRRLKIKNLPAGQVAMVELMLLRMDELEKQGLTMINIYNCWLGRRMVPLAARAHPMWKYTGQIDPTRSTATDVGIPFGYPRISIPSSAHYKGGPA
jgi:hypothetical protein